MFSSSARKVVIAGAALALAVLGGVAWHSHQTGTKVSQSFGAAGNFAYPVGPAGGALGGTYPNPTISGFDGGTLVLAGGAQGAATANVLVLDAGATSVTGLLPATNETQPTGDLSCTSGGACSVVNVTQQNAFTSDFTGTTTTNDATVTAIFTEPAEAASTTYDYVGTIVGQNTPTDGGAGGGDLYRADFAFDNQRVGSVEAGAAAASPVALNVRTTGGGNTWGGITFSFSGNSMVFSVAGIASTSVVWKFQVQRIASNP